jgi:hypothetical protein
LQGFRSGSVLHPTEECIELPTALHEESGERNSMKLIDLSPKLSILPAIALATLLGVAGCKSNTPDQNAQSAQPAQDQSAAAPAQNPADPNDPANANLAPVSAAPAPAASSVPASASAPPPDSSSGSDNSQPDQDYSEASYNDTPDQYAQDPPPALPDYQ